ncbi:MAG: MBL fold metallo-hydrolase, partial [Gammaproteobacteria bacterium]|nr:MBL fold metallo-hydrolase [Gammaproteobacteria bacterium]
VMFTHIKSKQFILLFLLLTTVLMPLHAKPGCGEDGVWLQVLGSGGPELNDGRASSGYLIWLNGKARLLIDMGTGSLLRFEQSGADLSDLDIILMSHFHVDHANDLPALLKASYFTSRKKDLVLYGPTGNQLIPSASLFVQALFGKSGAFKYLNSYLDGTDDYRLLAHDVNAENKVIQKIKTALPYKLSSVAVHHGPIPSLAWRVEIAGKVLVFSGDMNNKYDTLPLLATKADILIAHHAIPESATGVARNLHMPPSIIGKIAAKANVKQLVLSHHMNRTLNEFSNSERLIRQAYSAKLAFAADLQCFRP